jgi:hypothetical protein
MFCRYCGTAIAADSVFCPKCGKRLLDSSNPRVERIVRTLYLKTPYPYFIILILAFVTWTLWPRGKPVAYSEVKWSIEQDKILDRPEEDLFQQLLSLVVENTGNKMVREIPIDLVASIEPQQAADVVAGFLGRRLDIMEHGKPLPLTVILAGEFPPGSKRRFVLQGAITAKPPFKVTYEVREEGQPTVLAKYVVER